MTYLNWGCDPLAAECESCLNALCNVCSEESLEKTVPHDDAGSDGAAFPDAFEPDCDRCDLEKKPDCAGCGIILQVCLDCSENASCAFRISR
jgi:hypothetical protein